jgi:methyltransferase
VVSRLVFTGLIALVALQRVFEMRLSKRNEARMTALGGKEHFPGHFKAMKLLHLGWFFSMLAEVYLFKRPFLPSLSGIAALLFAAGQGLRYAAIRTLDWRWSVRIFVLPGFEPEEGGIYRYIRHPNYLGVILEILAMPLIHSAYITTLVFSLANGILLAKRISKEEDALETASGYQSIFSKRPRFFPRLSIRRLEEK